MWESPLLPALGPVKVQVAYFVTRLAMDSQENRLGLEDSKISETIRTSGGNKSLLLFAAWVLEVPTSEGQSESSNCPESVLAF